jgi:hypothetical protein
MDAEDGAVEVGGYQVVEGLVAVRVDAGGRADDSDGPRGEQTIEVHGANPDWSLNQPSTRLPRLA